ncbi:MAG: hypothetical protein M3N47_08890 [Chloroflexota bacterium]|nr:hypothetical protein [Chloroflexota bacterium]
MRSEPIDHLAATTPEPPHRPLRLRLIALGLAGITVLAAIVGCAEGTARDARQGQEEDAERTSVVRELQATQSARILEVTPTPP